MGVKPADLRRWSTEGPEGLPWCLLSMTENSKSEDGERVKMETGRNDSHCDYFLFYEVITHYTKGVLASSKPSPWL